MRTKRRFWQSILLLLTGFGLAACIQSASAPLNHPPLRIAYSPWPGYLPIAIAQAKGFFEQQGVKVDLRFGGTTTTTEDQMTEFVAGQLDGIALTLGASIAMAARDPDIRIVALVDQSNGADAIMAQPEIQQVRDLKGKRVGAGIGSFGELFVIEMLKANGMTSDDVILTKATAERVPELLENQQLAAGHTWEPYVSQSLGHQTHKLFTSEQTPGLIPDVITFTGSVVRDRPAEVQAFVRAWFQAVDYWQTHPQAGTQLIAKTLNLTPDTISLTGLKLLNREDNLAAFTPGKTTQSLYYTTQLYSDFFVHTGTLTRPVAANQLLDDAFLR